MANLILENPIYNIHQYDEILDKYLDTNIAFNIIEVFQNSNELFDFIFDSKELRSSFSKEIKNIIKIMKEILYTPPYNILFGRINLSEKSKKN